MSTDEDELRGRALAGRYRLDEPLAQGGMAQVWRGTDLVLGRRVAIKMLHRHLATDPAFAERFRREAQAAARLNHSHIVGIFDSVTEGIFSALILEYVDGITLRARLDEGPLDAHTTIGIGVQIALALHEAHTAGIVHRDIKPANVLLCRPDTTEEAASPVPRIRVTDFGIAKALDNSFGQALTPGVSAMDLTHDGSLVGTAKYLAPEQIQGGVIDARTDVYALGVVLYEAVTGRVPWQGDSDLATAVARLTRDPTPPREIRAEVPLALEAVILRALARDPAHRYPGAAELRAALLAADPGPTTRTEELPLHRPSPPPTSPRRRGWVLALVGAIAAAVAGGAVVLGGAGEDRGGVGTEANSPADPNASTPNSDLGQGGQGDVLSGLTASVYDPIRGDGENDELARWAVDGVTTGTDVWRTDCYPGDISDMSKPGVGLVLEAAQPVAFEAITVFTLRGGWRAQIYTSQSPASELRDRDLAAWGEVVARLDADEPDVSVDLAHAQGRTLMVLFTSVAGVAADGCFGEVQNSHRVDVIEIRIKGTRSG